MLTMSIPASFKPLIGVVFIMIAIAASLSFEMLFSVTFLFALLFLVAVVTATYAGAMMALEEFFDEQNHKHSKNGPQ